MCRKQPGIALGRLCDKCDGKCPVCDSYVRPTTLVRICDECSFGNYQNKCVVCGGEGISDAFYCFECTRLEKDRDGCPKIINLGSSRTDVCPPLPLQLQLRGTRSTGYPLTRVPTPLCHAAALLPKEDESDDKLLVVAPAPPLGGPGATAPTTAARVFALVASSVFGQTGRLGERAEANGAFIELESNRGRLAWAARRRSTLFLTLFARGTTCAQWGGRAWHSIGAHTLDTAGSCQPRKAFIFFLS